MKLLREILSDKSDVSCMRLMSIIALILAGWIAIRGLETHADLPGLAMLCGVFLGTAFTGKVTQKYIESKGSATQTVLPDDSQRQ